jgi:hypothetical protein
MCSVSGEVCCAANSSADYNNVWSLRLPGQDAIVTTDESEFDHLIKVGWQQVCNPGPVSSRAEPLFHMS